MVQKHFNYGVSFSFSLETDLPDTPENQFALEQQAFEELKRRLKTDGEFPAFEIFDLVEIDFDEKNY